ASANKLTPPKATCIQPRILILLITVSPIYAPQSRDVAAERELLRTHGRYSFAYFARSLRIASEISLLLRSRSSKSVANIVATAWPNACSPCHVAPRSMSSQTTRQLEWYVCRA